MFLRKYILFTSNPVRWIKGGFFHEIFVEGTSVILRKYEPDCLFCGSGHDLFTYRDKMICSRCLKEMKQL